MIRKTVLLLFVILVFHKTDAQNIGDFTSVIPIQQYQQFNIPGSHNFQVLLRQGDSCNNGVLPGLFDFTCFIPENGSSQKGQLSLNYENVIGDVSMSDIELDTLNQFWQVSNTDLLDFSAFAGTYRPCSGNLTPWGTLLVGEEYLNYIDADTNGLFDAGWIVEIDPNTRMPIKKLWQAGRCEHENAVVTADSSVLYTGADNLSFGYVYKFVPYTKGVLDSGALFALKVTDSTGVWIPIPNSTDSQRNVSQNYCVAFGATNFEGVEDVELGPDGKVYFATKGTGNVYRFLDGDTTVSQFDTFVVNQNYMINWGSDSALVQWGIGADNMAFDGDGNLWLLQDGGNNYIWTIGPNHTKQHPRIKIFGRVPLGSEPTGITFSPDYKYLFMSFQHPYTSNIDTQHDATGRVIKWDRNTALVIARNEHFGPRPTPLNVSEVIKTKLEIRVKRNPIRHTANFVLGDLKNMKIKVMNASGKKIGEEFTQSSNTYSLDFTNWSNGLYFVQFIETKSGRTQVFKILKN